MRPSQQAKKSSKTSATTKPGKDGSSQQARRDQGVGASKFWETDSYFYEFCLFFCVLYLCVTNFFYDLGKHNKDQFVKKLQICSRVYDWKTESKD